MTLQEPDRCRDVLMHSMMTLCLCVGEIDKESKGEITGYLGIWHELIRITLENAKKFLTRSVGSQFFLWE